MENIRAFAELEIEIMALRNRCMRGLIGTRYAMHGGQLMLLSALSHNGACNQIELAKSLNISPASVAVSLRRMESCGLVHRVPVPENRRANRVDLTPAGLEAAHQAEKILLMTTHRMLDGFSPAEWKQFTALTQRARDNLYRFAETIVSNETEGLA